MGWKDSFIEDYAGHPARVALNIFIVAAVGILLGHYVFELEITPRFLIGAMMPALLAMVVAGRLKAQRPRRR